MSDNVTSPGAAGSLKLHHLVFLTAMLGTLVLRSPAFADTPAETITETGFKESSPDPLAKPTAIVLNYCRASFHRIQKTPSKRVLHEEQEKILNNLNLNPIADAEIIRLYTAVLSEIADVQIADYGTGCDSIPASAGGGRGCRD